MGLRILFFFYTLILVAMGILFYFIIKEVESLQQETKDLYLLNKQTNDMINNIIDYLQEKEES